jgi:hypothetical protein
MRQRFRSLRGRSMARRRGEDGRLQLTPQQLQWIGWIAAAVLIAGIALVVGVLGGNGDGTAVDPGATPSASAGPAAITFGTALDPVTGTVSADATTSTFAAGQTFAYSLDPATTLPAAIYVEVARTAGGPTEVVQRAAEDGEQALAEGASVIAFTVAVERLLEVFGAGTYEMTIYLDPTESPIGAGTFTLSTPASPSGSASPAP